MDGQNANIWYFGNGAGIDFTNGYPMAINGELYTNEGCAVANDTYGKLLFYTDGTTVWNNKHDTISGAVGLGGGRSTTQSAVIVPISSKTGQYYIFTVSEQISKPGLSYSIIDIKANKEQGSVLKKNVPLLFPVTEKLITVKHCNGNDTWVIVHEWNTNSFYSYLVSDKGVSQPVISSVGLVHKSFGAPESGEAIGYLKASPDGKRLAIAINKISFSNIQLFDFNPASGKISLPVSLSAEGNAYGVSFSPDNTKLYITFDSGPNGLVQYDLTATDVRGSETIIAKGERGRFGALQTGPDEKIYIATASPYLNVITNPNGKGPKCNYKERAVDLMGKYSTFGLPSFPENIFGSTRLNLGRDTNVCDNKYELRCNVKANETNWSTGEKTSSIIVTKTGKYWLTIKNGDCTETDSITVTLNKTGKLKLELGKDTSFCDEQFTLDANNPGAKYKWSTGATTQKIIIEESGKYLVLVNDEVCSKKDSIKLNFRGQPVFIPVTEFTPNNGGFNERFDYIIENIDYFELKIENKKGKTVFKSKNMQEKWRGYYKDKIVASGVYSWTLKYKNECQGKETFVKKGEVKVLRFNY